mmetsp:Transcript_13829/g.43706  ORF Transcript_13829/g.43706 Transcript_13829/m.43706 type:complete len:209 (+) Transcript_13829:602-1228(+)
MSIVTESGCTDETRAKSQFFLCRQRTKNPGMRSPDPWTATKLLRSVSEATSPMAFRVQSATSCSWSWWSLSWSSSPPPAPPSALTTLLSSSSSSSLSVSATSPSFSSGHPNSSSNEVTSSSSIVGVTSTGETMGSLNESLQASRGTCLSLNSKQAKFEERSLPSMFVGHHFAPAVGWYSAVILVLRTVLIVTCALSPGLTVRFSGYWS